jgi:FkbM family methyltransferase
VRRYGGTDRRRAHRSCRDRTWYRGARFDSSPVYLVNSALLRWLRAVTPPPVRRVVHARNVARQLSRYAPHTHVGNYGGRDMLIRFEDPLAEGWYAAGIPSLPEIVLLEDIEALKPGHTVFDIGAHQGIVALMLADAVGARGRVVAVEAERHNARMALVNRDLNCAGQIVVEHAAISDYDGKIRFAESLNGAIHETGRAGTIEVDAVTIDTLASRHGVPDLVFLDVEGFEGRALRAAPATLASCSAFAIEVHVDQLVDASPADVVGLFDGWRRWVAVERQGWGHEFEEFDGVIPDQRFFLVAQRADA